MPDRLMKRIRARRALAAGVALAALSLALLVGSGLGQAQEQPGKPPPKVDKVDLSTEPVAAGWEAQVRTDANLVAVQWNGDQAAKYTVEIRDRQGEWRKAADTQIFDNGPDPGSKDATRGGATPQTKNVTEPVWVGKDTSGVRVRLDDGTAQDVTLHVIDSTRGRKPDTAVESTGTTTSTTAPTTTSPPSESGPPPSSGGSGGSTTTTATQAAEQALGLGQGVAALAVGTLAVAFIVRRRRVLALVVVTVVLVAGCAGGFKGGQPGAPTSIPDGIVSRSSWGGDLPFVCPGGPDYAKSMSMAIVHHTVNSNNYGPGDSVSMIRGIYAYHVDTLGYCDIAYNFILDNYGVPFEGRWGGIDSGVVGAHSLGWNYGWYTPQHNWPPDWASTGIAVLGTFSSVAPSGATEGTLIDLIRWKFKVHSVNPFEQDDAHILGHRDTYQTECPGQALYNDLPGIRHWVKAGW